jgi:hypothetical protein
MWRLLRHQSADCIVCSPSSLYCVDNANTAKAQGTITVDVTTGRCLLVTQHPKACYNTASCMQDSCKLLRPFEAEHQLRNVVAAVKSPQAQNQQQQSQGITQ